MERLGTGGRIDLGEGVAGAVIEGALSDDGESGERGGSVDG